MGGEHVNVDEGEVIVVRADSLDQGQMKGLMRDLLESGHENTIVFLKPHESIETASEATMRENGWIRRRWHTIHSASEWLALGVGTLLGLAFFELVIEPLFF